MHEFCNEVNYTKVMAPYKKRRRSPGPTVADATHFTALLEDLAHSTLMRHFFTI